MGRVKGTRTRYPGVYRINKNTLRIDGEARDPKTGRLKQVERILRGVTARQAAKTRAELLERIKNCHPEKETRQPLRAFCESWLKLKTPSVDWRTAETYAYALARVCGEPGRAPTSNNGGLGDFFHDTLDRVTVQKWVNAKVARGYSPETIKTWLRPFRTMCRDNDWADPTLRLSFPETADRGPNKLSEAQLTAFLSEMRVRYPQHFALTITLAFTGLRFCHATALHWHDVDEQARVIHVRRKQTRGRTGPVSRKKKAPSVIPIEGPVLDVLRWHRQRMLERQHAGLAAGWVFPSRTGGLLHGTNSLDKAWKKSLAAAGIAERFTVHGLRRTFNDVTRRAHVDPLVIKSITGHVTEGMREHYSTVDLGEKRKAVAAVVNRVGLFAATVDRTVDSDAETKEGR